MIRSIAEYAERAGAQGDADIAQLIDAEVRSNENIDMVRQLMRRRLRGVRGLDVVAFGSLARREWTSQSDFDFLILVHDLSCGVNTLRAALEHADEARRKLAAPPPGTTGTFGVVVSATELVARIGLETDTNQTLTRRQLMLQESVSLFDETGHSAFLSPMLDRYFVEYDGRGKTGVPRFLLNDVVRHWRTVAVDYQAKNWQRISQEGWGLRYLKLKISRKLAFAGAVAPLLKLHVTGEDPTEVLHRRFEAPSLARLSDLHDILPDEGQDALRRALAVAGRFNGRLESSDFREEAGSVTDKSGVREGAFADTLADADELQYCLATIFTDPGSPLKGAADKYLIW